MKLIFVTVLFFGVSALAEISGYDLSFELIRNGKVISAPQLLVKKDRTGKITEESNTEQNSIEVIATEGKIQNQSGILLNFKIDLKKLSPNEASQTIQLAPEMLVQENKKSSITIGKTNEEDEITLTVVAVRVN